MNKMNKKDLAIIIKYCCELSRCVSAKDAKLLCNFNNFNWDMSEMLEDLSDAFNNDEKLDFKNDIFYSKVLNDMKEDLERNK